MVPKLSLQERLRLVERVVLDGEPVSRVCQEAGISRVLFYRWFKRYKEEGQQGLGVKTGGRPREFRGPKHLVHKELIPAIRRKIVEEALAGRAASDVALKYNISRVTLYKWLNRYKKAPREQKKEVLENKIPLIEHYFRQTPEKYEQTVLSLVAKYPEYGIRRLLENLPRVAGVPIVGHHGVQNILRRHGLSLYEQRLAYSQAQVTPTVRTVQAILAQAYRFITLPAEVRAGIVRFAGITFLSAFLTIVVLGGAGYWWTIMLGGEVSLATRLGLFFASTALLAGSVFFLYSMKYYFTLAIVLSFSQQSGIKNQESGIRNGKNGGFLGWLLGLNGGGPTSTRTLVGRGKGLEPNLDHVVLKRHPYLSVHIPLYNEKNVVERVLASVTAFEYPNYEVIIADDSTDETTPIITDYISKNGRDIKREEGSGFTLMEAEVRPGVVLKHLHRTSRSGFKGGALKLALEHTDARAEFVTVFDADFVPYPDTLTLFLKYFQVTAGTLEFRNKEVGIRNKGSMPNSRFMIPDSSPIAAVQGYQWHVLNKSENWITRGVRSEYAGSYVVERSGTELYGGLKMIAGSVYMVRRDLLDRFGWETSITEDFELTLKLYESGYKVVYTPYIQAPAECVSTIRRLVRQRMRWAEGHSHNIRKMFVRLLFGKWETNHITIQPSSHGEHGHMVKWSDGHKRWVPSPLSLSEKLEFLYLSPYYLQAFFFIIGTFSWLIAETIFPARLPFWTSLWGWSLVLTNFLALPLVNAVGLFLEEAEERDFVGLLSFVALSYIVVPFQAYAAVKGFLEKEEGPWFRTPKTGKITDIFTPGRFYRYVRGIFGRPAPAIAKMATWSNGLNSYGSHATMQPFNNSYLAVATANNQFNSFGIKPKRMKWIGKAFISLLLVVSLTFVSSAGSVPVLTTFVDSRPAFGFVTNEDSSASNDQPEQVEQPQRNLAINTEKSVYAVGEEVVVGMGVVDKWGNTICDALLRLTIQASEGKPIVFTTEDGTIKKSSECGPHTVTNVPDYKANYQPGSPGTYTMQVSAQTPTGTYVSQDSFLVEEDRVFSIKRDGPTRINPDAAYTMSFTIVSQEDFTGEVKEVVPKAFEIREVSEGGHLRRDVKNGFGLVGEQREVSWTADWHRRGETQTFSYTFKAPLVSPELYLLGPVAIGENWQEARQWQIVADTVSTVYDGTITDATAYETGRRVFKNPRGLGYYYVFYFDSDSIVKYAYSSNGSSWTSGNDASTALKSNDWDVDIVEDGANSQLVVYMVYYRTGGGGQTVYRRGTISDSGYTITWGGEVYLGWKGINQAIRVDAGKYVWMAGYRSGTGNYITVTTTPLPGDSPSFITATNLIENTTTEITPTIISTGSNTVDVIWQYSTTRLSGAGFSSDGSTITKGTQYDLTKTLTLDHLSAVRSGSTTYVLYTDSNNLKHNTFVAGTGWGTETTVIATTTIDSMSLGVDETTTPDRVLAFYVKNLDNQKVSFKASNVDTISWGTESQITDGSGEAIDYLSASYKDWGANSLFPMTYTTQTTHLVRFVNAPENLWLFFAFAPLLPLLIKKLKKKRPGLIKGGT